MCIVFRKSACQFGQVKTKMYLPESPFFKKLLAGASGLVLMSVPAVTISTRILGKHELIPVILSSKAAAYTTDHVKHYHDDVSTNIEQ